MPTAAPSKPAEAPAPATVASLLDKGDGTLLKRGGVWTFPACPNDRSGTNLVLPAEFVSEAAVQAAIADGTIVATGMDGNGSASTVSRAAGGGTRFVNLMQAGSVEAATELPPNSRPTHDAGRDDRPVDVAAAQRIVEAPKGPMPSSATVVPTSGPAPTPVPPAPAAKP